MSNREVYRLWWDREGKCWTLSQHFQRIRTFSGFTKRQAIEKAARFVRQKAPSQLVIRNKTNGRINSERTYLSDPKRYVG